MILLDNNDGNGAGEDVSWLRVQKTPDWFTELMSSDSQLTCDFRTRLQPHKHIHIVCFKKKKLEKRQRQKQEQ